MRDTYQMTARLPSRISGYCSHTPPGSFMATICHRMSASTSGTITFQARSIIWSMRTRGSVPLSHITTI